MKRLCTGNVTRFRAWFWSVVGLVRRFCCQPKSCGFISSCLESRAFANKILWLLLLGLPLSWFGLVSIGFGITTAKSNKELIERFSKVEEFLAQNDYQRASQILSGLVKDYAQSEFADELRFGLAECYFNLGNYEQARAQFIKILESPRYRYIEPEAMYGMAISSIMLGDFRRADAVLEKLSKNESYARDERTNFARGVLAYFRQSYKEAVVKLEGLSDLAAKFYLAKSYAKLGKLKEAIVTFKEVTSAAPNTPLSKLAHFACGVALFENKDFAGARAKFQFFLENYPFSELSDFAHYFLGCALIAQNQPAQALEHLRPLTKHSNNLLAAHANYFIGYCKQELGEPQEAVSYFQKVRANYPKTRVAQYANLQLPASMLAACDTIQTLITTAQLSQMFVTGDLSGVGDFFSGVVCYKMGDFRRAANHFENIIMKFPQIALTEPACALLLLSLNSAGDYERAITLGAKYVKDYPERNNPWRAEVLYFLAEGYYYLKKYNEAENHYLRAQEQALAKNGAPIFAYARLGRAYSLYHLGRLTEAETEFKELVTQFALSGIQFGPNGQDTVFLINALLGYGYTFFNQKKYLEALDVFEAVVKQFPNSELACVFGYFYAGLAYHRLGYYGQAVDAWVALMNQYPLSGKSAEAAFRAGDLYFKAREYEKAVAVFRFVTEKHPNTFFGPSAQALIAQSFYNQKKFLEAIREYQKFLDLYPSDLQASGVRKSLEMSYYQAGLENPLVMQEFLARFPESELACEAQFDKARKLFDNKQYEQAALEFQKIVVNFPKAEIAGDAQLLTAESYANLKLWQEAKLGYQKFLRYYPSHPQRPGAYFNLATAYFNLGDYTSAKANFQIVIDSFPNSEFVKSSAKNIEICLKKNPNLSNKTAQDGEDSPSQKGGEK